MIEKNEGLYKTTKNAKDLYKFKIPSLRNLAYTMPYMHDGSVAWLDFVIKFYSVQIADTVNIDTRMTQYKPTGIKFTETEKKQIMAFLSTLNDTSFISDVKFSNPFKKRPR